MTGSQAVRNIIKSMPENELIHASKMFEQIHSFSISEFAYYKTLERLCKAGVLTKIAKGTYYRPKQSKYGIIPPSQYDIVRAFVEGCTGTVVGHALYNQLKLTTQVPKTVEILSSRLPQQSKTIRNVSVKYCNLHFTSEVCDMVNMLEVLQHFYEIQDINYRMFLHFCEAFSQKYSDKLLEEVTAQIKYKKSTLSFLRNILAYYGVPNRIDKYICALSTYKHPTMEALYEAAYLS